MTMEMQETRWSRALCRNVKNDQIFQDPQTVDERAEAIGICAACPLQEPCRAEALRLRTHDGGVWGIWGKWHFNGEGRIRRFDTPIDDGRVHGRRAPRTLKDKYGRRITPQRCHCEPCMEAERIGTGSGGNRKKRKTEAAA